MKKLLASFLMFCLSLSIVYNVYSCEGLWVVCDIDMEEFLTQAANNCCAGRFEIYHCDFGGPTEVIIHEDGINSSCGPE